MSSNDVPRQRTGAALLSALAVGALAVAVSVVHLPRPAESTTSDTVVQPAVAPPSVDPTGWLSLQTGMSSQVTYHDAGTGAPATLSQSLSPGNNCGIDQVSGATNRYLTFAGSLTGPDTTPSESLASYQNGSIGVKEKKSGTSCVRVDSPNEVLDLKLGKALPAGTVASSAFLDLELKQSARIIATAKLGGQKVATFELQSGASIGPKDPTADVTQECSGSADSGPDSGTSDNCRWALSTPSWLSTPDDGIYFDELVMEAVNGSFSLEGGADGTYDPAVLTLPAGESSAVLDGSIVEVVDQSLLCGDKTTTVLGAGDAPDATVTRLGNADGSTCTGLPYALDTGVKDGFGYAQFLKPLNNQATAQFIWDLRWTLPENTAQRTTALQDLKIDYETGETPTVLQWCPESLYDSTTGTFKGAVKSSPDPAPNGTWTSGVTDQSSLDGMQFACIIYREAEPERPSTSNEVRSHDRVYVVGDATMRH
jgi:hypothetical protein